MNTIKISLLTTIAVLPLLQSCQRQENKKEKEVKVEMKMVNDSTAEATITIKEDSAGATKETVQVIKGNPKEVKDQVENQKN